MCYVFATSVPVWILLCSNHVQMFNIFGIRFVWTKKKKTILLRTETMAHEILISSIKFTTEKVYEKRIFNQAVPTYTRI